MGFVSFLLVVLATATAGVSQTLSNLTIIESGVDSEQLYYFFGAEDITQVAVTADLGVWNGYYSVQWSETARFLGGKGWATGSNRNIEYTSNYSQSSGNSRLSLYGLTTDPLVEYRIVEDFSTSDQFADLASKGTVTSDGSVYNIYEAQRVNESGANFSQYWSVRQSPHSAGYITTPNHFAAWAALGMPLGEFESQFVALESHAGSGTAAVVVLACAAEYAQCGGQSFTGPTCCAPGLTCVVENQFFSNCFVV